MKGRGYKQPRKQTDWQAKYQILFDENLQLKIENKRLRRGLEAVIQYHEDLGMAQEDETEDMANLARVGLGEKPVQVLTMKESEE